MLYISAVVCLLFLLIIAGYILRNNEKFIALRNKQSSPTLLPEAITAEHHPLWTVVANIVRERPFGSGGEEIKIGTKSFRTGTKVYIIDWYAGMAENIVVVGLARNSRRLIKTVIRADYVEHLRVKQCYEPAVLSKIYEHFGNRNIQLTKTDAENMCDSIPVWGERFKKNKP